MKTIREGFLPIVRRMFKGKKYEVVNRGDAVNVLIVKPGASLSQDVFYFARQYRAGPHKEIYGNVAGMIDGKEFPATAAYREALEEAGASGTLVYMGESFNSPGDSTTKTHFFVLFVGTWAVPTDKEEGVTMHGATWKQAKTLMEQGLSLPCVHSIRMYKDKRKELLS